ncbi:MAG: UDP-N-acetylmuramate dehydrogenase [Crocinitomicaceae bacterium]|nr:UDP-N-acetylmuramate dehydrogenase [Crocinitomicaceae bacterium]
MIQTNIDLKPFNTFGISAIAKRFATFSSTEEITNILTNRDKDELLVLGGGSNLLLTQDFEGLVLKNEIRGYELISEDDDFVSVKVGAGEIWHEFVLMCIGKNLGGVENLSLIPGHVGASPMQNIGAYGVEIKDVFVSLEAYHIESGEVHTFDKAACKFGYRESVFKRSLKGQYIITSVTYQLTKKHAINSSYGAIEDELKKQLIENPTIKDISDAVIAIRSSKLPNPEEIGNAGSFFKNPVVDTTVLEQIQESHESVPNYPAPDNKVKLAAGWLIEQAGWKGKTLNNFGVHKKQALVLVNYDNCKGQEIFDLSTSIINDVKEKFGVTLEREVNII